MFEKINQRKTFKYLARWIQPNRSDEESNKVRAKRVELAYKFV